MLDMIKVDLEKYRPGLDQIAIKKEFIKKEKVNSRLFEHSEQEFGRSKWILLKRLNERTLFQRARLARGQCSGVRICPLGTWIFSNPT